ncbi:MAG TPA: CdaR family protein [Candidatus Limnocylindrales bacterium]|nr:CdaR family protein [Candidatus Limnocylindrales bacterium]
MTVERFIRGAVGLVVHNWPLKVAAIALATLLYAGLVASQDSSVIQGPIVVTVQNQPPRAIITNQLRDVESIRYIAPANSPRPRPGDFLATIDLTNVRPDGQPVNVPVRVTPVDPNIAVIDVTPRTIQVVLETSATKEVEVRLVRGPAPDGMEVGQETYEPQVVTVRGAASAVARVVAAEVAVALDPEGFDVDREIAARPVDANGETVTGIDVEPATVHVTIPLLTDKDSLTLPVNPVIAGSPAPGFRIAAVSVEPRTVTVEGDAEQLATLIQLDTAPVSVAGATADVTETVALAPPSGVATTSAAEVTVAVTIAPITQTRTYGAGIRLDGRDASLAYDLSTQQVQLTLFGSVADLDQLSAGPLEVGVNVAGLGPGTHEVTVVPVIPSGVEVVTIDPERVTVTVTQAGASARAGSTPRPGANASPASPAEPTATPSSTP